MSEARSGPLTNMYFIYILLSQKDCRSYVGYSYNVARRLVEHNAGQVNATRNRRPLKLIFSESFETEQDAKKRELYRKSGAGRRKMKSLFDFEPIFFNGFFVIYNYLDVC